MSLNDGNFTAALSAATPTLNRLDLLATQRRAISDFDLPTLEGMKFDLGTLASVLEAVIAEKYQEGEVVDHGTGE